MLTLDEQGFERFWGPSAIKPLNFNYEFQPSFVGQNIWTLTDDLFVPDHKRVREEEGNDFMQVIYSKLENVGRSAQKISSRYKQFPSIDHDTHQRSSSAQGSYVSRRLKIVGSPSGSRPSPTPPKPVHAVSKAPKPGNSSSTSKITKPPISKKLIGKNPASPAKLSLKKRPQQSGLTVKLSQQETEKLLKTLDFKVRTIRKPKPRDRSKSEALGRKNQGRTTARKRLSASKAEQCRSIKNDKKISLETQGLLKSSKMSSSSGKNSRSSSGLNELVGPLPKVNWQQEPMQQQNSSTASLKKKTSDKSASAISKTSATSKKVRNPSCHVSREPSSEANTTSQPKVKTTRVKIIPKVTLNNQLLKSTTPKTESKQVEKKTVVKAPPKKKDTKVKTDSVLWTPEKIALLDQITNDQQLKAVLMSAGDTYMKTKKYFSVKSNVKTKPPAKQTNAVAKKEPADKKTAVAAVKVPSVSKKTKQASDTSQSPSKEEKSVASDAPDVSLRTQSSKPEVSRGKSPEANAQTVKKGEAKQVTNSQLLKNDVVPKSAKPPKSPGRKVGSSLSPVKDSKAMNAVAANKKRPKYAINSKQVRKVEERLAQLSAEVTGNMKMHEKKVPQVQRTNLDHLRKIIDKSLSKITKEDNKAPGDNKIDS